MSSLVTKGTDLIKKLRKSAGGGGAKGKDLKYFTTTKKGACRGVRAPSERMHARVQRRDWGSVWPGPLTTAACLL